MVVTICIVPVLTSYRGVRLATFTQSYVGLVF